MAFMDGAALIFESPVFYGRGAGHSVEKEWLPAA
jgi:hypothetical protein